MEDVDKTLSKTAAAKIRRKQLRAQHKLLRDTGVQLCPSSSQYLFVCNAGLDTGDNQGELLQTFQQFGVVLNVIMPKGRAYSFVEFESITSAEQAMEQLNGKALVSTNPNRPLYLAFVDRIPDWKNPWNYLSLPSGLTVLENFVSETEEKILLECVNWDNSQQPLKHRRVKHYGYAFNYEKNGVDKENPLPEAIPNESQPVIQRLLEMGHISCLPDQLTVNEYSPGQGIPHHVDTHSSFEDPLISLSLGSSIVMEFCHPNGEHIPVLLPQRSLLVIGGESRYLWNHGITPRKSDVIPSSQLKGLTLLQRKTRTSFTFRKVLFGECHCSFPEHCDSRPKNSIDVDTAAVLEKLHVQKVYEEIAPHFSSTRHTPWPRVRYFVSSLPVGSVLIDVGCGNGKYLGVNSSVAKMGCDTSFGLLSICQQQQFEVCAANCLALPFRTQSADAVICIAVLHHLATEQRRLSALQEIVRVLSQGGRALIYVWAKNQQQHQKPSSYIKQGQRKITGIPELKSDENKEGSPLTNEVTNSVPPISTFNLPVHTNRTNFEHNDLLVPWKLKPNGPGNNNDSESVFHRFYHVFEEGELEQLVKKVNGVEVCEVYYDQGNWCIIFEKL